MDELKAALLIVALVVFAWLIAFQLGYWFSRGWHKAKAEKT